MNDILKSVIVGFMKQKLFFLLVAFVIVITAIGNKKSLAANPCFPSSDCWQYNSSCAIPTPTPPGFGPPSQCEGMGGKCQGGICITQVTPTAFPTATNAPKPPTPIPTIKPTDTPKAPTPTLNIGPISVAPTHYVTPTPMQKCTIGTTTTCQYCRCQNDQDGFNCAQGVCKSGPILCGTTNGPKCQSKGDCNSLCGSSTATCSNGFCTDSKGGSAIPSCSSQGGSCVATQNDCNSCGDSPRGQPDDCKGKGPNGTVGVCCVHAVCPSGPTPTLAINSTTFVITPCDAGGSYVGSDFVPDSGIQTAFGCLPTSPSALISRLIGIAVGIAGGIAFLLIILGGLKIMTTAGNPEAMNEGKEIITSALVGLILIIFSIFILRTIGVDIFRIPGFG